VETNANDSQLSPTPLTPLIQDFLNDLIACKKEAG